MIHSNFATKVNQIFKENDSKYGYPIIQIVLENKGVNCSKTKVYRYMKLLGLKSKIRLKRFKNKPKENKNMNREFQNIVNRQWNKYQKNELWVTDVSYIPLNKRFVYLSILKDVATGFVVGYKLSKTNDVKMYKDTWKEALKFNNNIFPKIIHSDNGVQYTSIWAKRFCKQNNLIISLSNRGCSLNNAACEIFFAQLKTECPEILNQNSFEKIEEILNNYMTYYNYERIRIKDKQPPLINYLSKIKSHSIERIANL